MKLINILYNLKKTEEWNLLYKEPLLENIIIKTKKHTSFENFVKELFKVTNITCNDKQIIQKAVLISRFPDKIISGTMSDYEKNLYDRSVEIFEVLNNNPLPDLNILARKLFTFNIMYKDWENKDKTMQINILCEIFNSYNIFIRDIKTQLTISNSEKTIYINCIHKFLNKILHTLKNIDKNWKQTLLNYKSKQIQYNEQSHNNMLKYLKIIFWENIHIEIVLKKNYNICNFLINDYINMCQQTSTDLSILKNFRSVETINDIYEVQKIMIDINTSLDRNHNYNLLFNPDTIVVNFQIIFKRLENLS